jgi:lipoprotein NlpD
VDYRELADFNGINPPYVIHSGQKIKIDLRELTAKKNSHNSSTTSSSKLQVKTSKNVAKPKAIGKIRSENKTQITDLTPNNSLVQGTPKWQWPASGKLIAQFQGETGLNKGIDIGANLGESVLAAASGQVVYAGTGLRGYGKLLIIKHNDIFLSAYAHNNELLVKEGDLVKVGQRIADMGSSGTDRVKLHFEIRSEGKPVDPLKYLPKR